MTNTIKKVIAGISALIIIAGAAVGGWAINEYVIKDNSIVIENPLGDNGGAVIGESQGNGISLMSTKIAAAEYEDYGISPMAESAQQITATITPASAVNKAVDWSIAWKNASSSWANGKTVTDYVTVTPSSDGALTANVECLQAFSEQIVITAISRENSAVKGTCTVDYAQRYSGTSTFLSFNSSSNYSQGGVSTNTTDELITSVNVPLHATTGDNTNTLPKNSIKYSSVLSDIYTIAYANTSVNFKYYLKLNPEFCSDLKTQVSLSQGTFAEDWTLFDETSCSLSQADAAGFASTEEYCVIDYFRTLCSGLASSVAPGVYYIYSPSLNQFIEVAQDYVSSYHYEIKIVATVNETSYETITQVRFTESSLKMHVTNISVGPNLVF